MIRSSTKTRAKTFTAAALLAALTALAAPAQGKGFLEAIFASSFVSSTEISTRISTEASSDSTSEGSGKPADRTESNHEAQLRYLDHNYEAVLRDAAQGGGEFLGALAHLLGCSDDLRTRVFAWTKAQHHRIFAFHGRDGSVDIDATLLALRRILAEDPTLAQRCSSLAPPRSSAAPALFTASAHTAPHGRNGTTCHPQPL